MTNEGEGSISCAACDRQYRWKQELTGRKMKCKCGEVVVMPDKPDGDSLYDLAAAEQPPTSEKTNCPSCGSRVKPGAAICINCGYNIKTGDVVVTAINAPATDQSASPPVKSVGGIYANAMASRKKQTDVNSNIDYKKEQQKNVLTPVGLIVGSIIILFIYHLALADTTISPLQACLQIFGSLILTIPVLLIGLYAASNFLGVGYGTLPTGLLKLVAIFLAPEAFAILLSVMIGDSPFFIWIISLVIYFALVMYLFELDFGETIYTVIVLAITKIIITYVLITAVLALYATFVL